ncbi:MAG: TRIC cation channel family protein [Cypionkella sp.]|uniref:trimeric intracellular cation channel family protein n=1 Tax=Cypionkella sp. TaxID=2811411 RepID=UPI002AB97526|nr:TRIC cation channel family protein [Cypionkella sp.]MDZ4310493.1 TRIC cation channel family protein [Cypionkella sp.]
MLWLDAIGMALVTVMGTAKATDAGAGMLVAIVMGVVTASVGGIIRDLLGHEPSSSCAAKSMLRRPSSVRLPLWLCSHLVFRSRLR